MGKYDFELDLYDDNTIAWIAGRVTRESKVLEFGSANGRLTKYLTEQKKCEVDIVEIDEESGADAARFAARAWVGDEQGDIENYHWLEAGKKYDYIVFADVLEHLIHAQEVLDKCKNVLNDNGKVLVSVPNISHNSIIIDLINDRFHYNSTGIMDNTHLRFFTRQSFAEMAAQAGWMIAEERAKNIRVGETEIKNSYADVSKEMAKELMARPRGNVYQYMFVLALNSDYVQGKCERVVSLDCTSYYQMEVQYLSDGVFDYTKSVSRQVNPYCGTVKQRMTVLENEGVALIKLLNCNCVVNIQSIRVYTKDGMRTVSDYEHNGYEVGSTLYFVEHSPEIKVALMPEDTEIELEFSVYKYDFEDRAWRDVYRALLHEQQHIKEICADYEAVLRQKEEELQNVRSDIQSKERQLQDCQEQMRRLEQVMTERQKRQITKK